MKYIMMQCRVGTMNKKVPVVFPDFVVHKTMAEAMRHVLMRDHGFTHVRPVSAGIIDLLNGRCYGESETLKLKSDPGDARVILTYEYTHGV